MTRHNGGVGVPYYNLARQSPFALSNLWWYLNYSENVYKTCSSRGRDIEIEIEAEKVTEIHMPVRVIQNTSFFIVKHNFQRYISPSCGIEDGNENDTMMMMMMMILLVSTEKRW
jgi:hypothetical protein